MNFLRRLLLASLSPTLLLIGETVKLHGQIAPEPEIRAAIPVTNSGISDPVPVPVRKAIPVVETSSSQIEASTPQPTATPVAAAAPASTYSSTDPDGSIRIAPAGTQDSSAMNAAQLDLAEGFFARKQPESAVPEYEKFLVMTSPGAPGRDRALYHLAESQRLMGSSQAAVASFTRLLQENQHSEYRAAAKFRLGELYEADGNSADAAEAFAQASEAARDDSIRQAAYFREALCREKSGQKKLAQGLLETLAKSSGTNSYRIPAQQHLANAATQSGNKEEALAWYALILSSETSGEAYSDAAVKSALLMTELGRPEEAKKLFNKIADSKTSGQWRAVAALGALRLSAQSGDEAAVLKISETALAGDPENKPEILLLRANALRKLGKYTQALTDYDTILREYPGSQAASLAPFQRLLALHATHAASLLTEIDQYLLTAADPADRERANLLRAEEILGKGQYKDAAALYQKINTSVLPPSSRPEILYKEAWALTQATSHEATDKNQAIEALSKFLGTYPEDESAPSALAQRAILKQQKNDLTGAVADFGLLETQYPKAPERELALQQKALILGQQQDNKGMVGAFTLLLHDYPESKAKAQAHYWIGWAAMENKDYAAALPELDKAREIDSKQFGQRAGLRILLAEYYLNQPGAAAREAAVLPPGALPPELARWLAEKALESGSPAKAEHFLAPLVKAGMPGASDADIQSMLASALIAEGKFRDAEASASAWIHLAHDPAARARALLACATIQRALKNFQDAASMTDEAMILQPEGPINSDARILSGDILCSRQDYPAAAKAYMTVAVLTEDPVITPKALTKAIEAYRKSGNLSDAEKTIDELKKRFPNAPVPEPPSS